MASQAGTRLMTTARGKVRDVRRRLLDDGRPPGGSPGVVDDLEYFSRLERSTASAILEIRTQMAREVDQAIRRLEAGGYGKCQDCLEPIPAARLRAVPFARRCRDCQEAAEIGSGVLPRRGPHGL